MREISKEYSSPRWAFMRSRVIGSEGSAYMRRLYVIQTPWFGIMFHRIYRADKQRDLHDHPWNFLSIVLRGNYVEDVPCECRDAGCCSTSHCPGTRGQRVRWFNIREVSRSPIWTLVFTGRKRRKWGFWVDGGTRWVLWSDYDKAATP